MSQYHKEIDMRRRKKNENGYGECEYVPKIIFPFIFCTSISQLNTLNAVEYNLKQVLYFLPDIT